MATEYQLPEYAQTGASLPAPLRSVLRGPIAVYDFLRRYPIVWVTVFAILVVLSAFAPLIAPWDPIRDADFTRVRNAPVWLEGGTSEFWLGTDQVGRDLWSRLLYGGRASLMVVAVGMTSGMIIGTSLGLAAGFIGGIIDEIIMRLVDAWIALPFIMIALVIKIVLGTSFTIMFLILVLISWVGFVRPVRGEVLIPARTRLRRIGPRRRGLGSQNRVPTHFARGKQHRDRSRNPRRGRTRSCRIHTLLFGCRHPPTHPDLGQHGLRRTRLS